MLVDDRERFDPTQVVIPIGGFHLPAPPDWRRGDEAEHMRNLARGALRPEDLTLDGRPRCTKDNSAGARCGNAAERGTTVCRFHGAANSRHPDDPREGSEGPGTAGRAARIERIRAHLELTADAAVLAIQSVLEDENARPQDRLKAAEIVLDRTVGRQITLDKEDAAERDLDQEILQIASTLADTGTEG